MTKPPRILIVDDDQNLAHTLADILVISGYAVETVNRAEDGLKQLRASRFDGVISDIRMPGMNGVEFSKTIRTHFPDLPIMLMTAYADYQLVRQIEGQRKLKLVEKPFSIPDILAWIKHFSEHKRDSTENGVRGS